jgi:hypothetical protein
MFKSFTQKFEDLDQHKAWQFIIGSWVDVGKQHKFCNPLRPDSHPGAWLEWYGTILYIKDYGDRYNSHIDCVTAWRRLNPKLNYFEALRDLLQKAPPTGVRKSFPKAKRINTDLKITFTVKPWSALDRKFWTSRGVSSRQLKDRVFRVEAYTLKWPDFQRIVHSPEVIYAYVYSEGKVKLYFPFRERTEQRFLSNLGPEDLWEVQRGSDCLLITKSHKDLLVAENICLYDLTHLQSENTFPEERIKVWDDRYKRILVFLDNDRAGIENAYKLANLFEKAQAHAIFVPRLYDHVPLSPAIHPAIPYFNPYPVLECKYDWNYLEGLGMHRDKILKDLDEVVCETGVEQGRKIFNYII